MLVKDLRSVTKEPNVDDLFVSDFANVAVRCLAETMKALGLCQPISIRLSDNVQLEDGPCAGVPILVAGAHRLEAAKRLGWSHIDCAEIDDDIIAAELWEIAENLHRCDLSKEQRDQHIRRYAELLEKRRGVQSTQNAAIESKRDDGRGHRSKGTARIVAEETGLSVDTVRRALNPRPVQDIKPAMEPEAEHDAIIREASAIVPGH